MVDLLHIISGRACAIYAMAGDGGCPCRDFLAEMMADQRPEFERMMRLLQVTSESGTPRNEQKCRFIPELRLFEFKTAGGVRIMAFWDEARLIVCSHGFWKQSQKTPRRELDRAAAARERYFYAKKQGQVQRLD